MDPAMSYIGYYTFNHIREQQSCFGNQLSPQKIHQWRNYSQHNKVINNNLDILKEQFTAPWWWATV